MKHTVSFQVAIIDNYLLFPIHDKSEESTITILDEEGNLFKTFHIRIAERPPLYYLKIDVSAFINTSLELEFNSRKLLDITPSHIKQTGDYQHQDIELHRPTYHYNSSEGWIDNPVGLFYNTGIYHLYYQHNPYGTKWGNLSWGHATSNNMVDWTTQSLALRPNNLGEIYSGSTIIDKQNCAGFGENAIIAFYTASADTQTQCIAFSTDNGHTFSNYEHNPILTNTTNTDFKDPKVFWHEETNKWIMALATFQSVLFYSSTNLKEWLLLSEFGMGIGSHKGLWECPDLFKLPYGKTYKWVLFVSVTAGGHNKGSAVQYFIGNFDGVTFTPETLPYPLWLDYGKDCYAGTTWHNSPKDKPVYIAWMSNWQYANILPTKIFKNAMTLPRTLDIGNNGEHMIVKSYPIRELKSRREKKQEFQTQLIDKSLHIQYLLDDNQGAYEIILEFDIVESKTSEIHLTLSNTINEKITYTLNLDKGKLTLDRTDSGEISFSKKFTKHKITAPLQREKKYKIKLYVDKCSSELFINKGKTAMTNLIFPNEPYNTLDLEIEQGRIDITKFRIYSFQKEE
ncbi:glycoside hydrolase family 32 protein [Myroides sp. M-43]|uniref:glycoside hydrolase family 32 protein n=1 Tax=Myroides oncorhynchi TaxID=2893756 RepID=UPI001E65A093|nr:glycoside hydrolase family 32 protein [Myroides oncorhynchi]MCC9042216.1 glycoside hydrolase family 32 protein [Myroides oncorhynchi]